VNWPSNWKTRHLRGKPANTLRRGKTKQGFIIFKVVAHKQPGIPRAEKDISDKIRETIYVQKTGAGGPLLISPKLREELTLKIKPGFVDSGASPNQAKPLVVAAKRSGRRC